MLKTYTFKRSGKTCEAVQVTSDNCEELAEFAISISDKALDKAIVVRVFENMKHEYVVMGDYIGLYFVPQNVFEDLVHTNDGGI